MYFDSHAHYDNEEFDTDRDSLLKNLDDVDCIINCGADFDSSEKSIALAQKYNFIYAAIGVHPENVENLNEDDISKLEQLAKYEKVKAIGEIGLDFHYENYSRDKQIYWFEKQIQLANKLNLPIIIHSRDAAGDTLEIVKANAKTNGVVHCFSSSVQIALDYINLGFFIGIGGVVTFKNGKKLVEVVQNIPIENILIETDCPCLSPEPHRGRRNDSSNLKFIAQKIAQIKNIPHDTVAHITFENAKRLFRI